MAEAHHTSSPGLPNKQYLSAATPNRARSSVSSRPTTKIMRPYQWAVVASDAVAVAIALISSFVFWDLYFLGSNLAVVGMFVLWMGILALRGSYEARFLGAGVDEYKRVITASLITVTVVGLTEFFLGLQASRGFVLQSFVVGTTLIVLGRWVFRTTLLRARMEGRFQRKMWLIGPPESLAQTAELFNTDPTREYAVVGTCSPPADDKDLGPWLDEQMLRLTKEGANAVAVAGRTVSPNLVRALAWRLEGRVVDLLVASDYEDMVGTRISIRHSSGSPFLLLEEPHLIGPKSAVKRAFDITGSMLLILLSLPLMGLCAVAVRLSGPGPVIYRQRRVGRNGELFAFPKFRTMVDGAEDQRAEIIGRPDATIAERYRDDPRITKVGHFLRRWSLDELPQLFTVFDGSMSLVGPRPMLPEEIALMAGSDHRRHIAQPGLTGLWQVGGRKDTTWEERMRLDLEYIERWSPVLDVIIMIRTVAAIFKSGGAY